MGRKKMETPPEITEMMGSGTSKKAKLKEFAEISGTIPPPGLSPSPVNEPETPEATGSVADVAIFAVDLILVKAKLPKLTEAEKASITGPLNEIEVRYMPVILAKYAEKASPFMQLGMAGFMIWQSRQISVTAPEAKTENQAASPEPDPVQSTVKTPENDHQPGPLNPITRPIIAE